MFQFATGVGKDGKTYQGWVMSGEDSDGMTRLLSPSGVTRKVKTDTVATGDIDAPGNEAIRCKCGSAPVIYRDHQMKNSYGLKCPETSCSMRTEAAHASQFRLTVEAFTFCVENNARDVIYEDDPRAGRYVENIRGWVDRKGRFHGQGEWDARRAGRTHTKCRRCGEPIPADRYYLICNGCQGAAEGERWEKKEIAEWDGKTPLYSDAHDRYLYDSDDVYELVFETRPEWDEAEPTEGEILALRLLLCTPNHGRLFSMNDMFDDILPEGMEAEDCFDVEIMDKIQELNVMLMNHKPVSWSPGDERVIKI